MRARPERPLALEPGHRYRVVVHLHDVAHAFPQGHNVRVAVSTCYWPVVWPSPEPVTLTLFSGTGQLDLPVRPARTGDEELPPFGPPEQAPAPESRAVTHNRGRRSREHDPTTGEIVSIASRDGGENGTAALTQVPDIDLDFGDAFRRTHRIRDAKIEWHQGGLYPRVGFIVTNLARPAKQVVKFYNGRGRAE